MPARYQAGTPCSSCVDYPPNAVAPADVDSGVGLLCKEGLVGPGPGDAFGVDQLADDPGRVASHKGVVRYVASDHRTGSHQRARADRHAGQDDRLRADPGAVTDRDRGFAHLAALDTVAVTVGQ